MVERGTDTTTFSQTMPCHPERSGLGPRAVSPRGVSEVKDLLLLFNGDPISANNRLSHLVRHDVPRSEPIRSLLSSGADIGNSQQQDAPETDERGIVGRQTGTLRHFVHDGVESVDESRGGIRGH